MVGEGLAPPVLPEFRVTREDPHALCLTSELVDLRAGRCVAMTKSLPENLLCKFSQLDSAANGGRAQFECVRSTSKTKPPARLGRGFRSEVR